MRSELPATLRAMLWSAYGDALGFISELTDERGLLRRARTERLTTTVGWVRRIGGEMGAEANLPAGTYSDDTQLRLATCRAIRANGIFDVEAFAKVELPVWPSYALGGGVGTKAAAAALASDNVNWYSNFYGRQGRSRYFEAGGNGAAMRIQPHVWASPDVGNLKTWMPDVLRNSVCTHGHARGFLGAVFHAHCLAYTVEQGKVPEPDAWRSFAHDLTQVAARAGADQELGAFWLSTWEAGSGQSLLEACQKAADECLQDIDTVLAQGDPDPQVAYLRALRCLDGLDPKRRGDGMRTALLAALLAYLYRDGKNPAQAMEVAANALGSDTDSIATMAGALLGQLALVSPEAPILDREYLTRCAQVLHAVSAGEKAPSFAYPDLMRWAPPKTQQDAFVVAQGKAHVLGLGAVAKEGERFPSKRGHQALWQRVTLTFGQTLFVKRRVNPNNIPDTMLSSSSPVTPPVKSRVEQPELFRPKPQPELTAANTDGKRVDELSDEAIAGGFNPKTIGEHILALAGRGEAGIERAVAYAGIIAKARMVRLKITTQRGH